MDAVTLNKITGAHEMAYVGERPWHGLGQKLEVGRSIDEWRQAAGMDWCVKRSRVRFGEGANQQIIDDKVVLFRGDTKMPLGIVSDKYKVVQPGAVLEFFRDLTAGNGYEMNTAGTLFDGKRFWALAKVGDDAVVVGEDRIGGYLLLSTSADGSLATSARFTTVRVVCNNTLSMALSAKSKVEVSISHRSVFSAESVKRQLGLATGAFRDFMIASRKLAETRIGKPDAAKFIAELLVETKAVSAEEPTKTKAFLSISDLVNGRGLGSQMDGSDGTLWGLVNGVTEYVDHRAKARSASHQLNNAWFGQGDTLKTAAMEKALALV